MGTQKYQEKIRELFEKSPVVSYNSVQRLIDKKGSGKYANQLIRNLILKNKIKNLTKGFYTLHNDPSLIVFSLKPAYLGLQDALSKHNLWEQETIPVIITSRKVRQGIRNINNSNVLIRRINKKYLFGIEYIKEGKIYLPYSDIEKTLIDMIYFNEKLSKEALSSIREKINLPKLNSYLKKYPERIKKICKKFLTPL